MLKLAITKTRPVPAQAYLEHSPAQFFWLGCVRNNK